MQFSKVPQGRPFSEAIIGPQRWLGVKSPGRNRSTISPEGKGIAKVKIEIKRESTLGRTQKNLQNQTFQARDQYRPGVNSSHIDPNPRIPQRVPELKKGTLGIYTSTGYGGILSIASIASISGISGMDGVIGY